MRHAVILAGGSGTRLWPASRRGRPKHYLPLGTAASESLLAATARRFEPVCPAENICVVTTASQVDRVREMLGDLDRDRLIVEPTGRNTAAAVGLVAVHLVHRDAEAIMGIVPSDHYIADEARFAVVVARAFAAVESRDAIATVGIVPTRPETGYGYLEVGESIDDHIHSVERFVEKPDAETAERYIATGNYLWNAGMVFVRARHILDEIASHLPETAAGLDKIARALASGGGAAADRATARVYPNLPSISIDHGILERTQRVITLRGDFGWNDVGSWAALADYRSGDASGNITQGTVITHEARENIVVSDPEHAVAVVGVDGLVVVQSGNCILVVPRERAQDVRSVVSALEERGLERFL